MSIPVHKVADDHVFLTWRDIKIEPGSMEAAHRHDYFQFMFLDEVKGQHHIDFVGYDALPRSLHFVGKGSVHHVDFNPDVNGGVFLFPEALFGNSFSDRQLLSSLVFFQSGSRPILRLSKREHLAIVGLREQVKVALNADKMEKAKFLLFALLIDVRELYAKDSTEAVAHAVPDDLFRYKQLLTEHHGKWNTIDPYSRALGLTTARMNDLCKTAYGKTALQILHEKKVLEAKRMLVYTDNQVKEIAFTCGFDDVAYFNRFFKKHTGTSPLKFRNAH